jgi:signal transduction histidine kinase
MEVSPALLGLIGLLLAAWTVAAAAAILHAGSRSRKADAARLSARRLSRMLHQSPAIPLLVRADGRIEAPSRLAAWLGLDELPAYLSELAAPCGTGLSADQVEQLAALVRRTQRTAAPFRLVLPLPGEDRALGFNGTLADPSVSPSGAALIWVLDISSAESELARLRGEAADARSDFAALVGLIEAAPMPMWFRAPDGRLRLVNAAYVEAVGAPGADHVIERQVELVEESEGGAAAEIALQAAERGEPIERTVTATIGGARRALKVTDLPLMREGIAGYAIDIEDREDIARQFRAFRKAQRSLLDQLSIGVAQFDERQKLAFANRPFQRIFLLGQESAARGVEFENFLTSARDNGRVPESRNFPEWRRAIAGWFKSTATKEENWPLSDGTHLRVIGQPLPDGGLVFIAEDRTEQLALSAMRDTLLRTRTATFDSLHEALAVFAPGGYLELWNRGFAEAWGIDPALLDTHPSAPELIQAIRPHLADPDDARALGDTIRAATLDRTKRSGRASLRDGRVLDYSGVPLPDGNGLLTLLDVTASRQAQVALEERARALEEADAVTGRFLANMSYEFRVPLTSIGGFAELLASGAAGKLTDQARDYAGAIVEAVERLTEQVENVLDLSQSEAGLLPLARQKIELLAFVTKLVRTREEAIAGAGITVDIRGGSGHEIDADPQQLARAIGHLLDNAIAASPKGRIRLELKRLPDGARIVLGDDGCGMTHEQVARALDGLRTTLDGKGLERRQGLGVPLAKQLIEAHGGTLDIASRPGAGTVVTIDLPYG